MKTGGFGVEIEDIYSKFVQYKCMQILVEKKALSEDSVMIQLSYWCCCGDTVQR